MKIRIYKSISSTFIGLLGSLFVFLGGTLLVGCLISKNWEANLMCLVLIIPGILLNSLAERLNEIVCAKKFLRKLRKSSVDNEIKNSVDVAIAVYQNYPVKLVEKYIAQLNPFAGEIIASANKNEKH